MDVRSISLAVIFVPALSGCTTNRILRAELPNWPWAKGYVFCSAPKCTEQEALRTFSEAGEYCRKYHLDFQKASEHGRGARLGVRGIGAVAGAILVNVTTGSATRAWGSVAGAANSFSPQMDGLLNSAVNVNQRASIETARERWTKAFLETPDAGSRVGIAVSLAQECSMSSAKAEQRVLDAISQASGTVAPTPQPAPVK